VGACGGGLAIAGLGSEAAMLVLFKRTVLSSSAVAALTSKEATAPPPPVPTGTIYWVATNGTDTNNGTQSSPFLTVTRALQACNSGDGIYVKAGIYGSGKINWNKSNVILSGAPGTTRDQVVLRRSAGSGNDCFIQLSSNRVNGGQAALENIQIYGVTIEAGPPVANKTQRAANWHTEGFWLLGYVHNWKLINCVVRHCRFRGILADAGGYHNSDFPHNIEVAYCDFSLMGEDTAGGDIALGNNVGFFHIHHNDLHGDVDGVVTENNYIGSLIEYNNIYDHKGPDGDLGTASEDGVDVKSAYRDNPLLPAGHRTVIRNNVIHGHPHQSGVVVQFGSKRVSIIENDIYLNGHGIWVRRGPEERGTGTDDVIIENNKIYDNYRQGIVLSDGGVIGGLQVTNNRIYDNGNSTQFSVSPWGYNQLMPRCGIYLAAGSGLSFTNNIISNNGTATTGNPQYYATIEFASDFNTFYLPGSSFSVGRVSNSVYTLSLWQSAFGRDLNSTEIASRYQAPATPKAPGLMGVAGTRNPGDTEQRKSDPNRWQPTSQLG
jgi:hypothetical protein